MNIPRGTYGFRFAEDKELQLCVLYAAGCDSITDPSYHWDGLERSDGPLLLFQYTVSGEGVFESNNRIHHVTAGQAFWQKFQGHIAITTIQYQKNLGSFCSCCSGPLLFCPIGENFFVKREKFPIFPLIVHPSDCCG